MNDTSVKYETATLIRVCEEYIKKALHMQKETFVCEKRPVYVKRDLHI